LVKVFFDTSVLVAASEQGHPHYAQALPALRRVIGGKDRGFMSVHSLAEMYAALTRLPVRPRIQPAEAARIITDNVLPHFEMVPIGKKDYVEALRLVGDGGWGGAKIYDALILGCANRSPADRIYTFNLVDFRQLAPNLHEKICAPA
jgi:predicted nucleic acid-binding protein